MVSDAWGILQALGQIAMKASLKTEDHSYTRQNLQTVQAFSTPPMHNFSRKRRAASGPVDASAEVGHDSWHCHFRRIQEDQMSVDGNWNMTMTTPMGERKATLSLKSAGNTLTGTQAGEQGSAEIADGKVDGNKVSWKVSIQNPMPLTLEFTGTVDGDNMKGDMGIGFMGSFPFTGTRA
jgi:cytochrome c1